MNRRAFAGGLAATLAAARVAPAQPSRRLPRIGLLFQGEPASAILSMAREATRAGLRDEGYVEGENITAEYRYASIDGLQAAANDLIHANVDVIIAGGTPAALASRRATKTIPIVAGNIADPVGDGLVSNLARPDANLTGNTFLAPELGPKRLQLLQEVVPHIRRSQSYSTPVYTANIRCEVCWQTRSTERNRGESS